MDKNMLFLPGISTFVKYFSPKLKLQGHNLTRQTESDKYINIEKFSSVIDKRFLLKTLPISDIALSAGVLEA